NRLDRIGAIVEFDIGLVDERAPDRFADHDLIVDQQHHDRLLVLVVHGTELGVGFGLHPFPPPFRYAGESMSTSLAPIPSNGRTSTAAASATAAFGMP